jgi:hypothetical protein
MLDINIARRAACLSARAEAKRWHAQLGHVNLPVLRRMANQELVRECLPRPSPEHSLIKWHGEESMV